ncbi:LINE-1 retrotransposable element ORF2 protein [Stylophora pistillata]|uniref:LINE-1 retrotransposable element ORF2 protein n=1 Tax=Stylophora pistillata TaxID=50429 RepID=A0A2B4RBH6_STYPI|nr:LINE-1 retrotransposable element ORF2 protein [Stylophora pistillata]
MRSKVQRRVREMENNWWIQKAQEIQALSDSNNSKAFFAATKKIYGPTSQGVRPVAGKDGTLHKDLAGIRDRWKEHFCELLNQTPSVNIDAIANLPQLSVKSHLDETPTLEDIATAIGAMKKGKAAGPDGIPAEAYKAAGSALIEKLHVLLMRIWDEEVIPSDLQDALIVTIFKKGDTANCENYRGISLLSIAGKIFARILACRLFPIAEEAFDSVHRPTLWKVLSKIGCPEKYIRMIRLLHDNMSASILIDGESTESFVVKTGVKQGCVIAPTLFSIFISAVLHLVSEKLPRGIDMQFRMDGKLFNLRQLKAKTLTTHMAVLELQYADDNALVTHTEEDLQVAVDAFSYAYDALGLTLNARNTQVLFQPSPDHTLEQKQPEITVGDTRLSSADHFSYLGSCLSCKADLDVETQVRLKSASAAFGSLRDRVFNNRNLYTNTKIKFYKAVILPTLLYGSEAWTTYSRHLKSLERYHQRCLRRILNIKWQDRRTNSSVLEEANVTSIESYIIKNQLRWAGHLVRMPSSRLPKKILYGELSNGRRNQGGQRKRFKDSLKHNLEQCGINPKNWEQLGNDRPSWRSAIHTGVAHSEQRRREHCESLRLARKERHQNASVVPTSTDFRCPVCQRICSSRIGLYSHQ